MANVLLFSKFSSLSPQSANLNPSVFGEKMGLMAKLFGCWHRNLSRPFTHQKSAYRSCLDCGARKQFNPETLETHGKFYFPPAIEMSEF
jgi:hypothetical protein